MINIYCIDVSGSIPYNKLFEVIKQVIKEFDKCILFASSASKVYKANEILLSVKDDTIYYLIMLLEIRLGTNAECCFPVIDKYINDHSIKEYSICLISDMYIPQTQIEKFYRTIDIMEM